MRDLTVIREQQARQIEATWNPNKQQQGILTTKYVLCKESLIYFKRIAPKVEELYNSCLYTGDEYYIKKPQGHVVNGLSLQLFISNEKPNSYKICVYNKAGGLEKTSYINKYVLQALTLSYGYRVRNAEYLVAYHWAYRQERKPVEVLSYLTVSTDGKILIYQPQMKLVYDDSSYCVIRGARTLDFLSETKFKGKIKAGKVYAQDLLSDKKEFRALEGTTPF